MAGLLLAPGGQVSLGGLAGEGIVCSSRDLVPFLSSN